MDYKTIIEAAITAATVVIGFGWFFWQRYQALEKRLDTIESALTMQKHRQEKDSLIMQQNHLNIQQLAGSNKALIDHRTQRFFDQIKAIEARLTADLREIKNFLHSHTEFKIRDQ